MNPLLVGVILGFPEVVVLAEYLGGHGGGRMFRNGRTDGSVRI